jgi:hypothetical protein
VVAGCSGRCRGAHLRAEVGGQGATQSLAVVKAEFKSTREGRHVDMADILTFDD